MLRSMDTISGRATGLSAAQAAKFSNRRESLSADTVNTAWVVLTKLRVNLGLTIATMAE